jgi:predicted deacetylase
MNIQSYINFDELVQWYKEEWTNDNLQKAERIRKVFINYASRHQLKMEYLHFY